MKCSLCPTSLDEFSLCSVCGRAFCGRHSAEHCVVCGALTFKVSAVDRNWRDTSTIVTWLFTEGVRVGLVGFDQVPPISNVVVGDLRNREGPVPFEVILFPNKDLSNTFHSPFSERLDPYLKGKGLRALPAASRYSVLYDRESGLSTVLLNTEVLSETSVRFVLDFLKAMFDSFPIDLEESQEQISKLVFTVLKDYNARFSIPFVDFGPHTQLTFRLFQTNLNQCYTEFNAVRKVALEHDPRGAADFLQYRLNLIQSHTDWSALDYLEGALEVFYRYVEAMTLVKSLSSIISLSELASNLSSRNIEYFKTKLVNYPDIVSATSRIQTLFDNDECFKSRTSYIEGCSYALIEAAKMLQPRYVRLDEAVTLVAIAANHRNAIELGKEPPMSELGSTDDLVTLASRVFETPNVYPEVRVMAGVALAEILFGRIIAKHDFLAYRRAIPVVRDLARLIEATLDEIMAKNPETAFKNEHGILNILSLAAAARLFGDTREAHNLEKEGREFLQRHDDPALRVLVLWRDFLNSHDYDILQTIYRECQAAGYQEDVGKEPLQAIIGHISAAVYETNERDAHLKKARDLSIDYELIHDTPISEVLSQNAANISIYLVEMFQSVFDLEKSGFSDKAVRKMRACALILDQELSDIHPARSLVNKAQCICSLIERDRLNIEESLAGLLKSLGPVKAYQEFSEICKIFLSNDRVSRKLIRTLGSTLETRDPWNAVALRAAISSDEGLDQHGLLRKR